eukprot:953448-Rhodomonas_salina.1
MEEARDRLEQHAKSLEKDMSLSNENAKMGLANAIAEIGELRSALAASTDDNARLQHQVRAALSLSSRCVMPGADAASGLPGRRVSL